MAFRTFFVSLLLISLTIASASFECTFCNQLVETAQTLVGKNEQEILSILDTVSEPLCSEINDKLSPSQCKSAFQLYGPYIVELLASGMKNSEVCGHIGMCDDSVEYTIIWPSINQDEITYSTKSHLEKAQPQLFKIFLGDSASISEENYALFTSLKGFTGTPISVRMTNNADFVETSSCQEGEECSIKTSKPGRRVWCYIILQASDAQIETDFELEIVEKNSEMNLPVRSRTVHVHIITFAILLTMMMTCICCFAVTKCLFARRREQRRTGNFMMDELMESPPMVMFIPFEGGYVPAYAPVPIAQL